MAQTQHPHSQDEQRQDEHRLETAGSDLDRLGETGPAPDRSAGACREISNAITIVLAQAKAIQILAARNASTTEISAATAHIDRATRRIWRCTTELGILMAPPLPRSASERATA